jgi:hypothetical protein
MLYYFYMAEYTKAFCFFQTSDNADGTFWIWASPQGEPLTLDRRDVTFGLDIKPGTPIQEAAELTALLRKYVTQVTLSRQ